MADGLEKAAIQWHPGFYSAAEIELISNKTVLEFQREYNLSKEPLRMDLLIIMRMQSCRLVLPQTKGCIRRSGGIWLCVKRWEN